MVKFFGQIVTVPLILKINKGKLNIAILVPLPQKLMILYKLTQKKSPPEIREDLLARSNNMRNTIK
jgi:hypothetical protein